MRSHVRNVRVGDRLIGEGQPTFFVAELGICHGGSVRVALDLAAAAIEAGAHCVKTETFQRETLVYDSAATCSYTIRGQRHTVSLAEHMDRYGMSLEDHSKVRRLCAERGVPFVSTVHDVEGLRFLQDIGADGIKIASPDLVHVPLLRRVAAAGLPVFLDTGAALRLEIEAAVRILNEGGCQDVVVNHNPAGHPAPASGHDLRMMQRLKAVLELPVGLADHFEGYDMLYAAVAAGANAVEKPVSFDRFVEEPERNWSITMDDLPQVLARIAEVDASLGCDERQLTRGQLEYRNQNRMALVTARDVTAGEPLDLGTVTFGRPRKGIGVEHWDLAEGRSFRRDMPARSFIGWADLD